MKFLHSNTTTYFEMPEQSSRLGEIVGKTAPIKKEDYSIAVTHLDCGGCVEKHYHKISDEVYVFVTGNCTLMVNDKPIEVKEGSVVVIEPGDTHEIIPTTQEVSFYAISIPPFTPEDFIKEIKS